MRDEAAIERKLGEQARKVCLGTLGDRSGVNVAKVEVSWYWDDWGLETEYAKYIAADADGLPFEKWVEKNYELEGAGHYFVHAGEDEDIYEVFERLTHEAMQARQERLGFDSYSIDDISAA